MKIAKILLPLALCFVLLAGCGKKVELAGWEDYKDCLLYTSSCYTICNFPVGYYDLLSFSRPRRALRNWEENRITVPVTAMTSATGSARNTARVWSASRWGSR